VPPVTAVPHAGPMDISDQFVPAGAYPHASMDGVADRRRRRQAVVIHVLGGIVFALSVPVGLVIIGLAQSSGSCSGVDTAAHIADVRRSIVIIGLVWSLLPFGVAVLIRSLRATWVVWAGLGLVVNRRVRAHGREHHAPRAAVLLLSRRSRRSGRSRR